MISFRLALPVLFLCLRCPAYAATFYVSQSGSDSASGAIASPWRTIQHGADALNAGNTLLIGPGTYRERIEMKRGGAVKAPITFAAQAGARHRFWRGQIQWWVEQSCGRRRGRLCP